MLFHPTYLIAFSHFTNLSCCKLSIFTRYSLNLMPCIFYGSGFMNAYVTWVYTYYTLITSKCRSYYYKVSLSAAHQKMHLCFRFIYILFYLNFSLLTKLIKSIARITYITYIIYRLKHFAVCRLVVIVVKSNHFISSFLFAKKFIYLNITTIIYHNCMI